MSTANSQAHKAMSEDALAENRACAAVVDEFKAFLVQEGIADPIVKLCDELTARIRLRVYQHTIVKARARRDQS